MAKANFSPSHAIRCDLALDKKGLAEMGSGSRNHNNRPSLDLLPWSPF